MTARITVTGKPPIPSYFFKNINTTQIQKCKTRIHKSVMSWGLELQERSEPMQTVNGLVALHQGSWPQTPNCITLHGKSQKYKYNTNTNTAQIQNTNTNKIQNNANS